MGIDSFFLVPTVGFLSSIIASPIVFLIVNGPIIDISIVQYENRKNDKTDSTSPIV